MTQHKKEDNNPVNEPPKSINYNLIAAVIVLIVIIIGFFVIPQLIVENYEKFCETGQIGDTIGGTMAPIVGLAGSIIVYLALREQVKANKLVQDQISDQRNTALLEKHFDYLVKSIDNFTYSPDDDEDKPDPNIKKLTGGEAVYEFLRTIYCNGHIDSIEEKNHVKFMELTSILEVCDILFHFIKTSSLHNRMTYWTLTSHQFRYRIYPIISTFETDITTKTYCEDCQIEHGLPEKFCDHIQNICTFLDIKLPEIKSKTDEA